jgi:hypothetical protein
MKGLVSLNTKLPSANTHVTTPPSLSLATPLNRYVYRFALLATPLGFTFIANMVPTSTLTSRIFGSKCFEPFANVGLGACTFISGDTLTLLKTMIFACFFRNLFAFAVDWGSFGAFLVNRMTSRTPPITSFH